MLKTILAFTMVMALTMLSTPSFAQDTFDFQQEDSALGMRCYIPPKMERVRGILLCGNGAGGDSRADTEDQHKRAWAAHHGFAVIATGKFGRFKGGVEGEDYTNFQSGLQDIALQSGHTELLHAPMLLWGFSNGGQMAYALARLHPERKIAFIVNKGGYYISDADGGQEPIAIPAIFFGGENDKGNNDRKQVIHDLYRKGRNQNAPWCWIEERNAGHEVGNSEPLAFAFFDAILTIRHPDSMVIPEEGTPTLKPLPLDRGWLVEEGHAAWRTGWAKIFPYANVPEEKRRDLGWMPTELLTKLYRSSASYDTSVKRQFSPWQKAIRITSPYNPAERVGRTNGVIHIDTPTTIHMRISSHLKDWQEVVLYVNGKEYAKQANIGNMALSFTLNIEGTTPPALIHAELRSGEESATRGSHVLLLMQVAE